MSILSLPRQHLKHHSSSEGAIPVARRPRRADDTVPNLATYHAPPAAHLRQGDRDETPLRFDDVTPDAPAAPVRPVRRELRPDAGRAVLGFLRAADPNAADMHREFGHHIPLSVGLRSVPLGLVVVDDVETVAADVVRLAADAGYVPLPIRIRLAAIAEQLAEVDAR